MTRRLEGFVVFGMVALVLATIGTATGGEGGDDGAARFATATFGAEGGRAAIEPQSPSPPVTFTEYRTPNGWLLRPAGTQLDTQRAPTGVTVAPDAQTVVAVNSGIFDQQITVVDASSLTALNEFTSDLYMGAVINSSNMLWVSTGNRNRIFQYELDGPVATCVRCVKVFPGGPEAGPLPSIPVLGYPGNMALGSDGRLFVVGNLSVPSSYVDEQTAAPGPVCPASDICSVVNVVDVSDPFAPLPAVRHIPVGRDAFGIALSESKGRLYVSNWADETNLARAGGLGTVSVVDLATETEVQVFSVGHHPTGLVLSPDESTLFVANSVDDTLTKLAIGANGLITGASTISVRTTATAPRAAAPLALAFSADGNYLLVGLAGQNAIEVRTAAGDAPPGPTSRG